MLRRALAVLCALLALVTTGVTASGAATHRTASMGLSTAIVTSGATVGVAGVVSGTGSGWTVELQRWTGSTWSTTSRVSTSSTGRFATTYRPATTGRHSLRARVAARGSVPAVTTRTLTLDVLIPGAVTLPTPDVVAPGDATSFTGRVTTGATGAPLRLERWSGSSWEVARRGVVGTGGTFTLTHVGATGSTSYRVVAPRHGIRAAATSATVVAVVRTPVPGETVHVVSGSWRSTTGWTAGDVVRLRGRVEVPAGEIVTVPAGVVLASEGSSLVVSGTLRLGDGVVLTTTGDPAVEVQLRARGSSGTAASRWGGVTVEDAGHADLADAAVRRAGTAVTVDTTASATWHGSVSSVGEGLRAYGYVDARGVDWGHPSGPAPYGSGVLAHGYGARVVPWVGYATPTRAETVPATVGTTPRCDDVIVLGARGSGETPNGNETYESQHHQGLGQLGRAVGLAVHERVVTLRGDTTIALRPVRYPAHDLYAPSGATTDRWPVFVDSLERGAAAVVAEVRLLRDRCPDSAVVLVGISQGAIVTRRGLQDMDRTLRDTVDAVVLVGDPSRPAGATERHWTDGDHLASDEVSSTSGLLLLSDVFSGRDASLPADVVARTTVACRSDDIFCTGRRGSTATGHLLYTWTEHIRPAGFRAGLHVVDALSARDGARRDGL